MKDEFKAYMQSKLTFDHFLDEKHVYHDSNGRQCSLNMMCIREPAWAANMIRAMAVHACNGQGLKSQEPLRTWLHDMHELMTTIVMYELKQNAEMMAARAMNAFAKLHDDGTL